MNSRNLDVLRVLVVLVLLVGGVSPVLAQDAPDDKVTALEKTVNALVGQVQKLSTPKPPTPAERTAQARETYTRQFAALRDAFGPACKAVKGRLFIRIDPTGKASVDCEIRE